MIHTIKKLSLAVFASLAICVFSTQTFAEVKPESPDAVIKFSQPKKLFNKLQTALRRVYPDPNFEFKAALILTPFGYPAFAGISEDASVSVCAYVDDDRKIFYVGAIEANDSAAILQWAEMFKINFKRFEEWLVFSYNMPPQMSIDSFSESAIKQAKRREIADASITVFDISKHSKSISNNSERISDDIESVKISLNIEDDGIDIKTRVKAKAQSETAKEFSLSSAQKVGGIKESKFISDSYQLAALYNTAAMTTLFSGSLSANKTFGDGLKKMAASMGESGAVAFDKDDTLYVYSSTISFEEYAETQAKLMEEILKDASNNDKDTDKAPKILQSKTKIEGVDTIVNEIQIFDKNPTVQYMTVVNGECIISTSKAMFTDALKRVKSPEDTQNTLKNYENMQCNAIIIANINKFLKSESNNKNQFGTISPIEIKISYLRDSAEAETFFKFESLKNLISAFIDTPEESAK